MQLHDYRTPPGWHTFTALYISRMPDYDLHNLEVSGYYRHSADNTEVQVEHVWSGDVNLTYCATEPQFVWDLEKAVAAALDADPAYQREPYEYNPLI